MAVTVTHNSTAPLAGGAKIAAPEWNAEHTVEGAVAGDGITDIVALTQAEYDAIVTPSETTLYVITDAE